MCWCLSQQVGTLLGGPEDPRATSWNRAALELRKSQRVMARVSLRGNRGRVSTVAEVEEARRKAEVIKTTARHREGGIVVCPLTVEEEE
ncbi:hypothetical protein NDU88_010202 [Pleurodeles waltl]|uniref:Uncharacterized protein n=1 Tax=Pleurodeles waltl TaxID=8319 RepID=A0AAV7QZS2_PLEWA|nr:hypothetical protein NDU88_010202 [Pleurodeles waltl]